MQSQYDIQCAEQPKKVWEFGNDELGCVSIFRGFVSNEFCVLGDIIAQGSVPFPQDLIPSFHLKSNALVNPISFQLVWTNNICSIWRANPPSNDFVVSKKIIKHKK